MKRPQTSYLTLALFALALAVVSLLVLREDDSLQVRVPSTQGSEHDGTLGLAGGKQSRSTQIAELDAVASTEDDRELEVTESQYSLSFRVLDESKNGIANATIVVAPIQVGLPLGMGLNSLSTFPPKTDLSIHAHSDQSGFVSIEELSSESPVAVSCSSQGFVEQRLWMTPTQISEDRQRQESPAVVLKGSNLVRVAVLDAVTSEAVKGAEVSARWMLKGAGSVRGSASSETGIAFLNVPFEVGADLSVRAKGYLPEYSSIDGATEMTVRLRRGRGVEVLVVEEGGGIPVVGARVFLTELDRNGGELADPRSAGDDFLVGVTGADGRLFATGIEPSAEKFQVFVQDGTRFASIGPIRIESEVELVLPASAVQTWQFITPQGSPIAGLEVQLVAANLVGWPSIAKGVTDESGECEFDLVPGEYGIFGINRSWSYIGIEPERIEKGESRSVTRTAIPACGITFALTEGVRKSPPQTLGFVRVYPQPAGDPESGQPHWSAMAANLNADRMGELMPGEAFAGLMAGEFRVRVRGENCVTQVFSVTLSPGEVSRVETTPIVGSSVRVVVQDELGAPIPHAWVWLSSFEELPEGVSAASSKGARADSQGFVVFDRAIPGRTRIDAAREFLGERDSLSHVLKPGKNEDVILALSGLLGGCDFFIDPLLVSESSSAAIRLSRFASDGDEVGALVAFDKIGEKARHHMDGLRAGRYQAELLGVSALDLTQQFSVRGGEVAEVTFSAPEGPDRWVEVLDSNGAPVSGASVLIVPEGSSVDRRTWQLVLMHPTLGSSRAMKLKTDSMGRAALMGLESASYEVLAFKDGFQVSDGSMVLVDSSSGLAKSVELLPAAMLSVEVGLQSTSSMSVSDFSARLKAIRLLAVSANSDRTYRLELDKETQRFESRVLPTGLFELQLQVRGPAPGEWIVQNRRQVALDQAGSHFERFEIAE